MISRTTIKAMQCFLLCALLAPLSAQGQSPELFPRPAELEPAINFWTRVYTEVDTQSGFLHDSQNLAVIYERLPLNRRDIEATRSRIQEDLRTLASGRRSNLSSEQEAILALWSDTVSDQTLRTAASNVRWQLGQSDRFLGGLQRSGTYRQHINQVIEEKNLPAELAVLPHVESSFNPGARSSASAAGMWQFGSDTGKRFMRIDHIVDERMDPYIASNAAMSLLEYNYSVLGTWPLALTAYNHGAGGIANAVRDTGTTDIEIIVASYKGRRFGFASRNFYAQFLAVNQVEKDAQRYFGDVRFNEVSNFRYVVLDAYVDAEVFASSVGISLEQLQADNRALRPVVWEGNKRIPRGFELKIRQEAVPEGDLLAMVPNDFKFAVQTPDVAYIVERGDSLSVIARRFSTNVSRLVSLNQLASSNRIQIGQRILLPQENGEAPRLAADDGIPIDGSYTVRRGDTVSLIAARLGVTAGALLRANGIEDQHRIYPGQQLSLPGFQSSPAQLAVIDADSVPVPPTQITFADDPQPQVSVAAEVTEAIVEDEEPSAVYEEPSAEEDQAVQLALNDIAPIEELLPPAAVLPDNVELESAVTAEEESAIALDPAFDIAQSNEQLSDALSADPSDYTVASNNSIEIQASETLGHYADWLGIRAWDLRRLNSMAYRDPVIIGKRLTLDFSRVNIVEFELKRRQFQSNLQQEFFSNYRILGVETYKIKQNDNIGRIASTEYSTPIWLLRQYNPTLDFSRIQIDQEIVFPLLQAVE